MLAGDPVEVTAQAHAPLDFAGARGEMIADWLEALLQALENELSQPNARGRVRRELDEVVWELERREADRRTQQRRQANLNDLRDRNAIGDL